MSIHVTHLDIPDFRYIGILHNGRPGGLYDREKKRRVPEHFRLHRHYIEGKFDLEWEARLARDFPTEVAETQH